MASQADIDKVKDNLPDTAAAEGWDDTKIGQLLDGGEKVDEVTLEYWESRAARTHSLTSISENGSSRSLGDVFSHSKDMAAYYRQKLADESPVTGPRPTRIRPIRRV